MKIKFIELKASVDFMHISPSLYIFPDFMVNIKT